MALSNDIKNENTSLPLVGKTIEQLSKKAVKKLFAQKRVKSHFQKHKIAAKLGIDEKLKALNLMSNGFVLKGTFLCLSSVEQIRGVSQTAYTSKFFSFEDTNGLKTQITEFVQGNLLEQFEQMITHLKNNLYLIRDIDTRTEDYQIPEQVFTELLANAFIHRSYENDALHQTKVELYPDRLELYNTGEFAANIDLTHLGEVENSVVINPEIVQVFFLHGLVETAAKGIKRSQEILRARKMQPAVFEQKQGYVKVTIYKKSNRSADLDTAYALIDAGRIVDFFDWAEGFGKNPTLDALKHEFIAGTTDAGFYQRLKVFAQMIK